jgi:hypothetical protein
MPKPTAAAKPKGSTVACSTAFHRNQTFVQTKWYVVPNNATNWFTPWHAPAKKPKESLERLGLEYINCCLGNGYMHASSILQIAESPAERVDSGHDEDGRRSQSLSRRHAGDASGAG